METNVKDTIKDKEHDENYWMLMNNALDEFVKCFNSVLCVRLTKH